jgi:hypothetical protein
MGGKNMTVSVVTYRKGGAPDAIAAAARKGKAVWDRSGAQNFMLSFVAAGPDAGQSVVLITFANWEAFGKAMEVASADPGLAEFLAAMDAVERHLRAVQRRHSRVMVRPLLAKA